MLLIAIPVLFIALTVLLIMIGHEEPAFGTGLFGALLTIVTHVVMLANMTPDADPKNGVEIARWNYRTSKLVIVGNQAKYHFILNDGDPPQIISVPASDITYPIDNKPGILIKYKTRYQNLWISPFTYNSFEKYKIE